MPRARILVADDDAMTDVAVDSVLWSTPVEFDDLTDRIPGAPP